MYKKTWHSDVFFGLHFDIHAQNEDTEIGKGLTVEHLIDELSKVRPDYVQCDCKGHSGYTSWPTKVGAPSPGIVADALRIWTDAAKTLGIPIVMHYSGVWDYAAILSHPEYGRVNAPERLDGSWPPREINVLGRDSNMTCPLSRYTQDIMIRQMKELIDDYGINGFWVDGECWASEPCYCEACIADYRNRRGDENLAIPTSSKDDGWWDWLSYQRDNFVRHVNEYTDAIHAHSPEVTICSNWMYTLRQPDDIAAPVDYISGDFTWIWSVGDAETEARFMASRKIEWELMAWGFTNYGKGMSDWVFKSVPALCQEAAVVLSCGGAFLVYDNPERTCRVIPWHMDILRQVADFSRARQAWHGGASVPQVAILHAAKPYYENSIPLHNLGEGAQPVEGALAMVLDTGYDADILNDKDFFDRISEYPVCVVPTSSCITACKADLLRAYAENGGILILSGLDGTEIFDEMLGVRNINGQAAYWPNAEGVHPQVNLLLDDGTTITAHEKWRLVETVDDKAGTVPLFLGRDPAVGMAQGQRFHPGIVRRKVGKGTVIGFFSPFLKTYAYARYPGFRKLFAAALRESGAEKALCRLDGPRHVHMSNMDKNGVRLIHLYNTGSATPNTPKSAYIEDVPRVNGIRASIPLPSAPKTVRLVPSGDPVTWSYRDGILNVLLESLYIYEILEIE